MSQKESDKVTPSQKKELIMSTQAYKEWWEARQSQSPVPSDPYRAFMIDISLRALRTRREIWEHNTNRTDMTEVDFPTGYGYRPTKPRSVPRKQEHRRPARFPEYVRPQSVMSAFESEIRRRTEEFSSKMRVPVPRVIMGKGILKSYYSSGWGMRRTRFGVPREAVHVGEPLIFIGASEKAKPQTYAALYHELGHHTHAFSRWHETGSVAGDFVAGGKVEIERKAWQYADPFLRDQRPVQKWLKRYVLGNYLGQNIQRTRK